MSGSQSSPLTLAMLLAGNSNQQPQDPAIAAALPRLQMSQALMQQGMSDAPTTKWGGISRVGQALLGNYLFDNANSGIQDILKQKQADSANIMRRMQMSDELPGGGATPAPTVQQQPQAAVPGSAPTSFAEPYVPGQTNYYPMVRAGEAPGSGDTSIKNPLSSAAGPVQATDSTWGAFLASPQGKGYTMADRSSAAASQAFTQWNGDTNAATIQAATGQPPTTGHVVAAHLIGGQGAANLLAHPDEPISKYLTPGAISGNAAILSPNMTGAEAMASIQSYYGGKSPTAQVAGPGAPQTPGAAPTAAGTPPAQGTQAGGHNAQYYMDMLKRGHDAFAAASMDPYNPTNKSIQSAAQSQIEYAKEMLGHIQKTFTDIPGGNGAQRSGTNELKLPPTQRLAQTQRGDTIATDPFGGPPKVVFSNPTGISGTGVENETMRTIAELGPKVVAGTATPQERATYDTAATTYQGFKTATNPADQSLIRVPTNPMPPGMPPPGGSATSPVTQLTPGGRGPTLAGEMEKTQSANDAKAISEEQATVMKSHDLMGTTQTIRSLVPQVTEGTGADQRLRVGQVFSALGVSPETVKSWTGTDTPSGELLQKKLFELSTGATRAMGAREPGSVMMMFQKNYPNLDSRNMTIDAMTRLLDMDQLYKESEIGGRQQHLQGQVASVSQGQPYQGLSGYQQPDPRVYQAAALASGGMPFSVWTQGLSPVQQQHALLLAEKTYPDATAMNRNGQRVPLQRPAQ